MLYHFITGLIPFLRVYGVQKIASSELKNSSPSSSMCGVIVVLCTPTTHQRLVETRVKFLYSWAGSTSAL